MNPSEFERLGAFYLGRRVNAARQVLDEPIVIESRDLVTHGVCVGMTGSGKTGLCIALLEEAAIDGVPAIIIDPKGDLASLCLSFPHMSSADLAPFVDPAEASRKGLTVDGLAEKLASGWRAGWEASGQGPDRVQRYRDAVEVTVFTPGSSVGVPLAPLGALLPPARVREDEESRREHCATTAAALLSLVGEDSDATAQAHVLLSLILDAASQSGEPLDLALLLRRIQAPPFDRVGLLDLETFFPSALRMALVMKLNAVLASPSMAAWMQGAPLDAEALLVGKDGKPRFSIINIAHLADNERVVFVARLAAELLAWTRAQRGTGSLRAMLFIDEVMGYMPPVANPPSKTPLLTLFKQGRAFGVGVLVATQNPVDLDYKALGNAGTWLLGRLQTERDRMRVLDGLEGASLGVNRKELDGLLASLDKRQFVLVSAHRSELTVFESRQTLCFLSGPLAKEQLRGLRTASGGHTTSAATRAPAAAVGGERPILEPGVTEKFAVGDTTAPYAPHIFVEAKVHYAHAKHGVDDTQTLRLLVPLAETVSFSDAKRTDEEPSLMDAPARPFLPLPSSAARLKSWEKWRADVVTEIVRRHPLMLVTCPSLGLTQAPGTGDDAFKAAVVHAVREARDAQVEKLKSKMQPRLDALEAKLHKAQERVRREDAQASAATMDTALTVGTSILGALFGRKTFSQANLTRASSSARRAKRAVNERGDVAAAREALERLEDEAAALAQAFEDEQRAIHSGVPPLEVVEIAAKKSDVEISKLWLLWS